MKLKRLTIFIGMLFLVLQVTAVEAEARRRGLCKVQRLQAKIKTLQTQLQQKEQALKQLQSQLLEYLKKEELKELRVQLDEKIATIKEKDLIISNLTATTEGLKEHLSTMHQTIKQLASDIQKMNEQLESQRELVDKLQRRVPLTVDISHFLALTLISSVVASKVFK